MELTEYFTELQNLEDSYKKQKYELDKKFAFAQNKYEIGDFIQDTFSNEIGKIEKITVSYSLGKQEPECQYLCRLCTKKSEISKRNTTFNTWSHRCKSYTK